MCKLFETYWTVDSVPCVTAASDLLPCGLSSHHKDLCTSVTEGILGDHVHGEMVYTVLINVKCKWFGLYM